LGDVPDWVYWGAACDAAMVGENDKAIKYLADAIDHGFNDIDHIKSSKFLTGLHDKNGWEQILERLEREAN
jgi:hypothetical protein